MQKIIPHLWYDREAEEAAQLYTSVFANSKITNKTVLHDTPSGDAMSISLQLAGQDFMMINAGPFFKFNPSVSFSISCDTKEEVDTIWNALSPGGSVLMPLGAYPFSGHYGWTTDKFGVSWQVMLNDVHKNESAQKITPTMMFVGNNVGKAEEAITFYTSVFHSSKIGSMMRYEKGEEPDKEGTLKYVSFTLEGQDFAAMDSAYEHKFTFNEAVSFIVKCETQEEIDYYWEKLSAVPESEQCGWLKDKYGFSWQVTPTVMDRLMADGDQAKIARVTQAFLKMKKFNIAELEAAAAGK